jgi:hypothetical protein
VKNIAKAIVGILMIFVFHLPRHIFRLLLVSYAAVFNNRPTLTANPAKHIKRAKAILRRELRFALERMAQKDLIFADRASNRMLKEYDPAKKVSNLHRLSPDAAFAHEIYLINKATGKRHKCAEYKPLDKSRVEEIKGRLGDLLHPKEGLRLGIPDDPWYIETKRFLNDSLNYLSLIYKDNSPFFFYEGREQFEMVKVEWCPKLAVTDSSRTRALIFMSYSD